ncbi:MAG: hypothetical protein M3S32_05055 [Acidobacteriota bacterium]|nr:hypothetical protein [Acidobacteriota bacterium]
MPTTNAPASVPQERTSEETSSQRNERLYLGNKELKFVIKLSIPIPV